MSSSHRIYLDRFLQRAVTRLHGDVLDVGGRRVNRKGVFRVPEQGITSWRYLNIDAEAAPDILCNAEDIPLPAASVDGIMLSEVLEHLEQPGRVLRELVRILRPGGRFSFAEHVVAEAGTPTRWAQRGLRRPWAWVFEGCSCERDLATAIRSAGFSRVDLQPYRIHSALLPFNTHIAGTAIA